MPTKLAESELGETAGIVALTHDLGKASNFFQRHLKGETVPKKNCLNIHFSQPL